MGTTEFWGVPGRVCVSVFVQSGRPTKHDQGSDPAVSVGKFWNESFRNQRGTLCHPVGGLLHDLQYESNDLREERGAHVKAAEREKDIGVVEHLCGILKSG